MIERLPIHTDINGIFYRAIDPLYREFALSGSSAPGRYSNSHQPTLYLSSSPEGVEAAMQTHKGNRSARLEIVKVRVIAHKILDLRNSEARRAAGIDLNDAISPWQEAVKEGGIPRSWHVRERLESLGMNGLIDPSRKAPGLWHLVLFSWNGSSLAQVSLIE
ncbi:RES domain-containing protein [Kosakonia sp. BK9b]